MGFGAQRSSPGHAVGGSAPDGDSMSLWTRFLDWLLGQKVMSIEDLKAIQKASLECLQNMFDDMNEKIDVDDDGMISVREAWTLLRGIVSYLRTLIKKVMK